MKDLTTELVKEVFEFYLDAAAVDGYSARFMELLKEFQDQDANQILTHVQNLDESHIGMSIRILGGTDLGTLNDVPKRKKDRDDEEGKKYQDLRGNNIFLVVDSKFVYLERRQVVILTDRREP